MLSGALTAALHDAEGKGLDERLRDLSRLCDAQASILDMAERILQEDLGWVGIPWPAVLFALEVLAGRIVEELEAVHEGLIAARPARVPAAIPREQDLPPGVVSLFSRRFFAETRLKAFGDTRIEIFRPAVAAFGRRGAGLQKNERR